MDIEPTILLAAAEAVEHAAEATDGGVIGTLGINAKLFIAQLVNFVVVLFVLWKWVFGPVAGALEKRRERVEKSIKDAKEIEERVQKFEQDHEDRLKESRREADVLIQKAIDTANQSKAETIATARQEADKILLNARETIDAEKDKAIKEVREEVAELTVACTEKVIQTKLDDKKDKDLIKTILREVE